MNVARAEATAVNQLLSAMEEAFGKKAQAVYREPARDCDIVHSYLDHQRMREVFGWTPEFSLQEGLRSMAESLESK
jgi:UDP-glucose 4-epimerase